MKIPSKALQHVRDGLSTLDSLEAGGLLHYLIVRLDGPEDADVRVVFGPNARAATKEVFARVWSDDAAVKASDKAKWQIARGAIVLRPEGLTTIPALRGNHVLTPSETKIEMKAMQSSLSDSGVSATPLKKVTGGKFVRAADTAKLDGAQAVDVADDEKDLKVDAKTTQADVKTLVGRFRELPVRKTIEAAKEAVDEETRARARVEVERVRKELGAIEDEAVELDTTLRQKVLGTTRYKDSLRSLDELLTRARAAQRTMEGELGFLFERTVLAGGNRAAVDPILATMRDLVAKANGARDDAKIKVLAELWFAADLWLKNAGVGSRARRTDAPVDPKLLAKVQEVYEKASRDLAKRAGVPINGLPSWIEAHHGKGMEKHGTELDITKNLARFLSANERELFRVHVKGGKLYQYPWWAFDLGRNVEGGLTVPALEALGALELVPVESSRGSTRGVISAGYTGFVMSMGSDLYMTAQHPPTGRDAEQTALYHSAYMAGLPIQAAGEMLVRNGDVEVVNPNSGHYRPTRAHIVQLLRRLEMQGVKVAAVGGVNDRDPIVPVADFLRDHGHEVPDADAFRTNDEAMAKVRYERFLTDLFRAEKDVIEKASSAAWTLDEATKKWKAAVARLPSEGEPPNQQRAVVARKAGFDQKKAAREAEEARLPLAGLTTFFERKLGERELANAELRAKDAVPSAAPEDGYVTHLKKLIERTRTLDRDLRTAIEAVTQG